MSSWPLYFSDNLHLSNPESETGVLCLWTKKERVIEKLDPKLYSFIGQLYSKDYGVMILIRNLLAKNDLRNLVLTGIDLNGAGEIIKSFFELGVLDNRKIIGTQTYLDNDIKKEHVDLLRRRINFIDLTHIKNFEEINNELNLEKKGSLGENIILDLPKLDPPSRLPTDFSGFKARGVDFTTAYKTLINFILKFGVFNSSEKKLKAWNITLISKKVTEKDKQFLGNKKKIITVTDSELENKYYSSKFYKKLDAWESLKEIARNHVEKNSLNIMCFEAYIKEKDLESAYELVGSVPDTQIWDQDPHGNLVIRVEGGLIRVTHFDEKGKILGEFYADNAKELYKKIIDDNKVSLLSHALDIGGEIKRAEQALIKGQEYIQDKKLKNF